MDLYHKEPCGGLVSICWRTGRIYKDKIYSCTKCGKDLTAEECRRKEAEPDYETKQRGLDIIRRS